MPITTKDKPKTVCITCRWHERRKPQSEIWFHQFCTHPKVQRPDEYSTLTGKPVKIDSPYCRDVNNGDCVFYEEAA